MDPEALRAWSVAQAVNDALDERAALEAERAEPELPDGPEHLIRAQRVVDDALTRRRWTERDRQALRSELMHLRAQAHEEITLQIARAMNEGKLDQDFMGPPF